MIYREEVFWGVEMTLRDIALELLAESECPLDAYKGEFAQYALPDILVVAKERDIPFPAAVIAEELIRIGNEKPDPPRKGHLQYKMVFDTGDCVDGIEFDDFDAAKADALSTLEEWMADECSSWTFSESGIPMPSSEQIESWDSMIANCSVYVVEWDDSSGAFKDIDDAWFPSYEDEKEIGWQYWREIEERDLLK